MKMTLVGRLSWYVGGMLIALVSTTFGEVNRPSPATMPLPEAVASFGAVTSDAWIYVYSGHIGTAHDHSRDNLSQSFRRRRVEGGPWEELPMQTPLQGLALVAHDGYIYRIGGMTAKNAADEDAQLFSQDTFARFDPQSKTWEQLAPLPEGRSSHDAVVIDSKIYVVGGWKLSGDEDGAWHSHALCYDIQNPDQGWTAIEQPFERRALAATQHRGKLYVIGGMDSGDEIDRTVNVYNPSTSTWANGPSLPGEGMNGFGASAWNPGDAVLASGSNGIVYRLSEDGTSWTEAARMSEPRFFHQLVPAEEGAILALGGASRKGHLTEIERIQLDN